MSPGGFVALDSLRRNLPLPSRCIKLRDGIADPELAVPAHAQQNHVGRKTAAFEIGHGEDLGEPPLISLHAANECNRAAQIDANLKNGQRK